MVDSLVGTSNVKRSNELEEVTGPIPVVSIYLFLSFGSVGSRIPGLALRSAAAGMARGLSSQQVAPAWIHAPLRLAAGGCDATRQLQKPESMTNNQDSGFQIRIQRFRVRTAVPAGHRTGAAAPVAAATRSSTPCRQAFPLWRS